MNKIINKIISLILCITVTLGVIATMNLSKVYAADTVTIVIDPGHGGSNLGTDYLPVPEKNYNMVVALYMKEQLKKYQNVKVFLTHTEDIDMSLQQRAEYAAKVNADFLISLHFNMSLSHSLYGSEVWIPSTGSLYSQGYSLGTEFMNQFEQMGLFNRGIKTRIGKNGNDYYGIIRQCSLKGIPSMIVEHCHVDHNKDASFIQSTEKLKEFGVRDAEAVAKYFGLVSKDKKTDYRTYAPLAVPVPTAPVCNDVTAPTYVNANLVKCDKTGKYATVNLTAFDGESVLQYYSYSYDNGITWSELQPWSKGSTNMAISINIDAGRKNSLVFRVYNQYDLYTVSNTVKLY